MKVIFLDIDGVLNSLYYDSVRDWKTLDNIDKTRLPIVKQIVDATGAEIVLSSTWRVHWEKGGGTHPEGKYIDETFAEYGLRISDKTPFLGHSATRRDEIAEWLKSAPEKIDAFVIIDDEIFGWGDFSDRWVKTDPRFHRGLEQDDAERAIEILNK